jgi:hypothetical protein
MDATRVEENLIETLAKINHRLSSCSISERESQLLIAKSNILLALATIKSK